MLLERRFVFRSMGVPVLAITRRTVAGDRVVEVAVDITLPADRNELRYEISLE
jgi:hypothetical protein